MINDFIFMSTLIYNSERTKYLRIHTLRLYYRIEDESQEYEHDQESPKLEQNL